MATAIIEVVIGKLAGAVVGKLGEIAVEQVSTQASLLLHFREDFEWLKKEFTKIEGYLQHEHGHNESLKNWLADVQDIALDAEDIVEECAVQPLYGDSFIFRYQMGRRIKKIRDRMESIMKDAANLNQVQQVFHAHEPVTCHGRAKGKKSALVERDAKPVAIDAKVDEILDLLKDDALQVIALCGMGGIGKTFLMRHVYNHHKVLAKFDVMIWLSISQVHAVARLQNDIASHLGLKLKEVSEERAAELIHKELSDKRSLIVLDDVWGRGGANNLIESLGIGCTTKVVVTTRSIDVCGEPSQTCQTYHMKLLSGKDSWNLFCLHAFPDDQQKRPSQELNEVAHQVETECHSLPLAIKTVAASMASQKLLSSWESKLRQLKEVSVPEDPVRPILLLSYDALPKELKPCFLYFSFFGEDVEIDAEYLISLWIGEGFIPQGKDQWTTGWRYLEKLNNLCLVEVSEDIGLQPSEDIGAMEIPMGWKRDKELKKTCKIHDLLLDLIKFICKENKCAFTVEETSGCRRIFLAKAGLDDDAINRLHCPPSLRTLSLSGNTISITELPTKSVSDVRALRVIDLSYTMICRLPRCIGNLKLLKVLNLGYTHFRKVPDCVKNLKSLCFLNVRGCDVPKWIGDLKCLQHLHVWEVPYSREISRGVSKLVCLRTLRSGTCWLVLKDVAKLIHLQEVRIDIRHEEEGRSVEEGVLAQLVNMRHLTVFGHLKAFSHLKGRLLFPEKMKALNDLEYLYLKGFTVPGWLSMYENLRVLRLRECKVIEWPALERMSKLVRLKLHECTNLPKSFGNRAFPQLRSFEIDIGFEPFRGKLPDLEDGAMPHVVVFKVMGGAEKIPKGLEHLRSLELLDFSRTIFRSREIERLEEGGEYWKKIKDKNPHVTIKA